jgi:hypothetical protein
MLEEAKFDVKEVGEKTMVDIQYPGQSQDLDGISFITTRPVDLEVSHKGRTLGPLQYQAHEQYQALDREGVSIVFRPWQSLEFPRG